VLQNAESNLAKLETAGQMVPSLDWFVDAFVRREAVISSQIEGTQASLTDLLTVEAVVAAESVEMIGQLLAILNRDRDRYLQSQGATVTGVRLFEHLPQHPIVTTNSVVGLCGTTKPTATKAIVSLCDAGILEETSGRARDRTYAYREYLELLREGTEI